MSLSTSTFAANIGIRTYLDTPTGEDLHNYEKAPISSFTETPQFIKVDSDSDNTSFFIAPIVIGLRKYTYSTTQLSDSFYFPNSAFDSITNHTKNVLKIDDTFSHEGRVSVSGGVFSGKSCEDVIRAEFNFDFSFTDIFERHIATTLGVGDTMDVFIKYYKYKVTEYVYEVDPLGPITSSIPKNQFDTMQVTKNALNYKLIKTNVKYVYKPMGLYYKTH